MACVCVKNEGVKSDRVAELEDVYNDLYARHLPSNDPWNSAIYAMYCELKKRMTNENP